jgi:hypothetical protein
MPFLAHHISLSTLHGWIAILLSAYADGHFLAREIWLWISNALVYLCPVLRTGSLLFLVASQHKSTENFFSYFVQPRFGITENKDLARTWLLKSSELGFYLADLELESVTPEYDPKANNLIARVESARVIAKKTSYPLNQFTKIENRVQNEEINGVFDGFLMMYDYSGTKITEATPIKLDLQTTNDKISGTWTEEGVPMPLSINGFIENGKVIFNGMKYQRPNHYHQENPLT